MEHWLLSDKGRDGLRKHSQSILQREGKRVTECRKGERGARFKSDLACFRTVHFFEWPSHFVFANAVCHDCNGVAPLPNSSHTGAGPPADSQRDSLIYSVSFGCLVWSSRSYPVRAPCTLARIHTNVHARISSCGALC